MSKKLLSRSTCSCPNRRDRRRQDS